MENLGIRKERNFQERNTAGDQRMFSVPQQRDQPRVREETGGCPELTSTVLKFLLGLFSVKSGS